MNRVLVAAVALFALMGGPVAARPVPPPVPPASITVDSSYGPGPYHWLSPIRFTVEPGPLNRGDGVFVGLDCEANGQAVPVDVYVAPSWYEFTLPNGPAPGGCLARVIVVSRTGMVRVPASLSFAVDCYWVPCQ